MDSELFMWRDTLGNPTENPVIFGNRCSESPKRCFRDRDVSVGGQVGMSGGVSRVAGEQAGGLAV
ncbi:hypothetical protein E2C01_029494 [Portunus trituberculatus]|uniref:Uncharacterized protein n=1 Tax=Portunus trituberculatus TaxID=210409 RepID=A0A5B7ESE1_PORTR|nr:hypothetical protein [Portunus trituberculatus]